MSGAENMSRCGYRACGREFIPANKKQKYCSVACRTHANNEKNRERARRKAAEQKTERPTVSCANPRCRMTFVPDREGTRYCSEACRLEYRAIRRKERGKREAELISKQQSDQTKHRMPGNTLADIAKVAREAAAAGMSYGLYVAGHRDE